MNRLNSDDILERFLAPQKNPEIPDPYIPQQGLEVPGMLKLSPKEVIVLLAKLHLGYRITQNLSNLSVEDVLELLYDCEGMINRLEIFNLKDYAAGKTDQIADISRLQQAINLGNVIQLKRLIRNIISKLATSGDDQQKDRTEKLSNILHDIATLRDFYKGSPLKARIGSDSTDEAPGYTAWAWPLKIPCPAELKRPIRRPDTSRGQKFPSTFEP